MSVRCNYIDVNVDTIQSWGEWRVGQVTWILLLLGKLLLHCPLLQLTGAADWFKLRVPYDCSSLVHYYQLQGAFWKDHIGGSLLEVIIMTQVIMMTRFQRTRWTSTWRSRGVTPLRGGNISTVA